MFLRSNLEVINIDFATVGFPSTYCLNLNIFFQKTFRLLMSEQSWTVRNQQATRELDIGFIYTIYVSVWTWS